MSDFCDQASKQEAALLACALNQAVRGLSQPKGSGPEWIDGIPHCRICGEPIPQRRIDALPGVGICVDCAREME